MADQSLECRSEILARRPGLATSDPAALAALHQLQTIQSGQGITVGANGGCAVLDRCGWAEYVSLKIAWIRGTEALPYTSGLSDRARHWFALFASLVVRRSERCF